jgi:hypothetical protein
MSMTAVAGGGVPVLVPALFTMLLLAPGFKIIAQTTRYFVTNSGINQSIHTVGTGEEYISGATAGRGGFSLWVDYRSLYRISGAHEELVDGLITL